jgi:hypothetical protein
MAIPIVFHFEFGENSLFRSTAFPQDLELLLRLV